MSAIVVDDDDFTRVLLTRTLESAGHTSVVAAADAATGMRLADTHRPDLAILDLDLGPGPNGIDLAHGLRRLNPTIAIIILSSYQDPRLVGSTRPMPLGAIYVSKRSVADAHVLEQAVGEVLVSPLAERAAPAPAAPGSRRLSDNQVEIMRLVAEGYSNAEIARRRSLDRARRSQGRRSPRQAARTGSRRARQRACSHHPGVLRAHRIVSSAQRLMSTTPTQEHGLSLRETHRWALGDLVASNRVRHGIGHRACHDHRRWSRCQCTGHLDVAHLVLRRVGWWNCGRCLHRVRQRHDFSPSPSLPCAGVDRGCFPRRHRSRLRCCVLADSSGTRTRVVRAAAADDHRLRPSRTLVLPCRLPSFLMHGTVTSPNANDSSKKPCPWRWRTFINLRS